MSQTMVLLVTMKHVRWVTLDRGADSIMWTKDTDGRHYPLHRLEDAHGNPILMYSRLTDSILRAWVARYPDAVLMRTWGDV